jgi:hypothetical protein
MFSDLLTRFFTRAVSEAIEHAQECIYIEDWWLVTFYYENEGPTVT